MENLGSLYKEMEGEALKRKKLNSKAEKIRTFVSNLADFTGEKRLLFEVVWNLASDRIKLEPNTKPLDKTYFKNVVRKAWTLESDEERNEWIRIDKPKRCW